VLAKQPRREFTNALGSEKKGKKKKKDAQSTKREAIALSFSVRAATTKAAGTMT
jgi:hypothetical protein